MKIQIESLTDIGQRQINEDSFYHKTYSSDANGKIVLACACDGVGGIQNKDGRSHGEDASKFLTASIEQWFENEGKALEDLTENEICEMLRKKVKDFHLQLVYISDQKGIKYGTTLTLIYIIKNTYFLAQVGDSRAYLMEGNMLKKISKDQTQYQKELDEGLNPSRNDKKKQGTLLQCVGTGKCAPVVTTGVVPNKCQFYLCSDGIPKTINIYEIEEVLKTSKSIKDKLIILNDLAREKGEKDNITALLLALDN